MNFKLPIPQRLRQLGRMDCGVEVFAHLTGLSREEILRDKPDAFHGLTVNEWETYLEQKGFDVVLSQPDEALTLPCAVLVDVIGTMGHWIYQSAEAVFDPSPVFQHMPADDPRMLEGRAIALRVAVRPPLVK